MKNNKLLIVLLSVLLVSLSGCSIDHEKTQKPTTKGVTHVTTEEGVECVVYKFTSYNKGGGGISCNWEGYNNSNKAN